MSFFSNAKFEGRLEDHVFLLKSGTSFKLFETQTPFVY
jgi:hypothetical protein